MEEMEELLLLSTYYVPSTGSDLHSTVSFTPPNSPEATLSFHHFQVKEWRMSEVSGSPTLCRRQQCEVSPGADTFFLRGLEGREVIPCFSLALVFTIGHTCRIFVLIKIWVDSSTT
jgi:hypothetical protein